MSTEIDFLPSPMTDIAKEGSSKENIRNQPSVPNSLFINYLLPSQKHYLMRPLKTQKNEILTSFHIKRRHKTKHSNGSKKDEAKTGM